MSIDTTSLQALYNETQETPKLAKSIKEHAERVDYMIDIELPSIKTAVENNKLEALSNVDFAQSEIDTCDTIIGKINGALGI